MEELEAGQEKTESLLGAEKSQKFTPNFLRHFHSLPSIIFTKTFKTQYVQ